MKKNTMNLFVLILLFSTTAFANLCDYQDAVYKMSSLSDAEFKDFARNGQKIDQILVSKKYRRVYLLRDQKVIRTYRAAFGDPRGPKRFQGDLKTPEGVYYISKKNSQSAYHLSLEISYPSASDVAYAQRRGRSPGGDVMIHGLPSSPTLFRRFAIQHPLDWTRGCIAVNNTQIREIYSVTEVKTPITLCPLK